MRKGQRTNQKYRNLVDQQMQFLSLKKLNLERADRTVGVNWRSQAVPDEILENILQLTPTVRSAFLSSVSPSLLVELTNLKSQAVSEKKTIS